VTTNNVGRLVRGLRDTTRILVVPGFSYLSYLGNSSIFQLNLNVNLWIESLSFITVFRISPNILITSQIFSKIYFLRHNFLFDLREQKQILGQFFNLQNDLCFDSSVVEVSMWIGLFLVLPFIFVTTSTFHLRKKDSIWIRAILWSLSLP